MSLSCVHCGRPLMRAFVTIGEYALGPKCATKVLGAGRRRQRRVRVAQRAAFVDPRQMDLLEALP